MKNVRNKSVPTFSHKKKIDSRSIKDFVIKK